MKGEIALITCNQDSLWTSCQKINRNLFECYQLAFGDKLRCFPISRQYYGNASEIERIARSILRMSPDQIVFLSDPHPHPIRLVRALDRIFGPRLPALIFHTYGDFLVGCPDWLALLASVRGGRIGFIGASPRQSTLLANLVGRDHVKTFPFPVGSEFHFDLALRKSERKRFSLKDSDRLIVYTGRLTYQKNVLRLIDDFIQLSHGLSDRCYLYLAGNLDHFGAPYQYASPMPGRFYEEFKRSLEHSRVKYLGNLSSDELHRLYNAADVFASLSTFHDEDFGMSPAEALMCGLPTVLSDWGGYQGFSAVSPCVGLVEVQMRESGLALCSRKIQGSLRMALDWAAQDVTARQRRARQAAGALSVAALAKKLRFLHHETPPVFWDCTPMMRKLAARFDWYYEKKGLVFSEGMGPGTFYENVYGPYFAPRPPQSIKRQAPN